MWYLITSYLVGLVSAFLLIFSASRMDENLPHKKLFFFCKIPQFILYYTKLAKKEEREKFLLFSVILQLLTYLMVLVSSTIFIYALISQIPDVMFFSACASFVISAVACVEYIAEMIIALFYKKNLGDE